MKTTLSACRSDRGKRGMTLVEASVALLVFSIWMAGACRLVGMSKELSDNARAHYLAVNLAKNRIERAKALNFDVLGVFLENQVVVDNNGNPSAGGRFRRTTAFFNTPATTNLKEVVVTVEIKNRLSSRFAGETEVLRSYVANIPEPTQ